MSDVRCKREDVRWKMEDGRCPRWYGPVECVSSKVSVSVKGLGCTLLFIGFAKVLDVPFGYHLGKMLMIFVVDDMEEERLCHTVNLKNCLQ